MPLTPGTRLGPYEVTAQIGVGGMGEVYKATDTNLKRSVAIKVLPASVAGDAERLARFQREAEVLAALNHPNIAAIYGLEESEGITALVMELVEGDDLSQRIARGAIPIDEALPIAKQIAEALEAAHEQGIIHRDLKPANIKVRSDGTVKVLDFGLAKAMEPVGAMPANASMSPTITSPAMTQAGMILGTAAYMSPEQARGKPVDKRSDIWAFGCVLYETLTGRRAFDGEDMTEVLGAVVHLEPNWAVLSPDVPPPLRTLLHSCLIKDPRRRVADISTALFVLEQAASLAPPGDNSATPPPKPLWRRAVPLVSVGTLSALTAGIAVSVTMRPAPAPPHAAVRFAVPLPSQVRLNLSGPSVAIAPDGRQVIYTGIRADGVRQMYSRSLDSLESVAVSGAEGALNSPFVSPDGEQVGYLEGGSVKSLRLAGGRPTTICDACDASGRASWGANDTIVFPRLGGLVQMQAAGGEPAPLTTPKGETHGEPHFLPDGKALLFTVQRMGVPTQIAVMSLDTREPRVLLEGSNPHFAAGQLIFSRGNTLWTVAFDVMRLQLAGNPAPALEGIQRAVATPIFDVAADGTLVFSPEVVPQRPLVWVDRSGREEPIATPPREYSVLRLSPDGTRIALEADDQERDIWIWDLPRAALTRFTTGRAWERTPVWTPDGRRLLFASDRDGVRNLYWRAADGSGPVERLTQSATQNDQGSFAPDGARLVFRENPGRDLSLLTFGPTRNSRRIVATTFYEENGEVSPGGRWLAYESDESGQKEVYIRPFPKVGDGRWQVSAGGGKMPAWARSGTELFYLSLTGAMMAAPIQSGSTFAAGTPVKLFEGRYFPPPGPTYSERSYDVSADGRGFLMIKEGDLSQVPGIVVIESWLDELRARVPAK